MRKRSARNRRSNDRTAAWLMLVLGVAIVGSVLGYVKLLPADRVPLNQRRGETAQRPTRDAGVANLGDEPVKVLIPRYVDGDLQFEHKSVQARPGADRFAFAVNEFLKEAKITPTGARVLTTHLDKGNLVLDFSREFDQTYGTEDEQTLVNGILTALGQFKGVETVEFQIGGKAMETLGNIDLTLPLPVIRER